MYEVGAKYRWPGYQQDKSWTLIRVGVKIQHWAPNSQNIDLYTHTKRCVALIHICSLIYRYKYVRYDYETQQVLEGRGSVCVATLTFLRDPLLWSSSSSSSAVKYDSSSSSSSSWCLVKSMHDSGKITPLGNPSKCVERLKQSSRWERNTVSFKIHPLERLFLLRLDLSLESNLAGCLTPAPPTHLSLLT